MTMSCTPGTLYGIGVGPGSPDLLTVRAAAVLQRVHVVLAAASSRNDYSVALSIASPHLPQDVRVEQLAFPMTRDEEQLRQSWEHNADTVAAILRSGKDAAFLTLGDPLIYSTFGYLLRTMRARHPDLPVQVVPGITSYQAAAAHTATILCEGEENLLLMAGINGQSSLEQDLVHADNAGILTAYRNIHKIKTALAGAGKNKNVQFLSRVGLEGEVLADSLDAIPEKPHYLSLILATAPKNGDAS